MLKQRIITGLILGTLVVWGVVALPDWGFALVLMAVMLLAAWEWASLIAFSGSTRIAYCAAVAACIAICWWVFSYPEVISVVLYGTALFWVFMVFWLISYGRQPQRRDSSVRFASAGLITLTGAWVALVSLRSHAEFGSAYILFLFALIWAADSGAYFSGKRFGRRKLAPTISPGKTLEGVCGALAITVVTVIIGYFLLHVQNAIGFLLLSLVTVIFSIIGDLSESMLKRQHGAKDSGTILPGHGGILDRIDSLIAAAPVFLTGLYLLQT